MSTWRANRLQSTTIIIRAIIITEKGAKFTAMSYPALDFQRVQQLLKLRLSERRLMRVNL